VGAIISGIAYSITALLPGDPLALWKNGASEISKILTVPIEAIKANPKFYAELALSGMILKRVIKHGGDALEGKLVKGLTEDVFFVLGINDKKELLDEFEETEGWKLYEETANLTKRLRSVRTKAAALSQKDALAADVAAWRKSVKQQWEKPGLDALRRSTFNDTFPPPPPGAPDPILDIQYPGAAAAAAAPQDDGAGLFPPEYQAPRERSSSRDREEEGTGLARYGSQGSQSEYEEDETGRPIRPVGRGRRTGGTRRKARRSFRRSMRRKSHKKRMNKRK
jgi:hypothetical protein